MQLYGTTSSPYVRRVRVVAKELGVAYERIDTATEAGQASLRDVSPIRKVPVAVIDGRTLRESHAIMDWLVTTRGFGGLSPPRDPWHERNLIEAADAALDSMIHLFYLRRDGVAIDGTPYAIRQLDRTDAIFGWLAAQLAPDRRTFGDDFGLAELAVITALDWMDFRRAYPTGRASGLVDLRAAWADRPSLSTTRPG
jgi:glutathione S-transferase